MEGYVCKQTIEPGLLENLQCMPGETDNCGDVELTKDKTNSFAFMEYIFRPERQNDAVIADTHPQPSGNSQPHTSHSLLDEPSQRQNRHSRRTSIYGAGISIRRALHG
jgi:hypothetical protein